MSKASGRLTSRTSQSSFAPLVAGSSYYGAPSPQRKSIATTTSAASEDLSVLKTHITGTTRAQQFDEKFDDRIVVGKHRLHYDTHTLKPDGKIYQQPRELLVLKDDGSKVKMNDWYDMVMDPWRRTNYVWMVNVRDALIYKDYTRSWEPLDEAPSDASRLFKKLTK